MRLEVKLSRETVWLSTGQMALLFDREESNIRRHIINVFKEGELTQENNVQKIHVNGVKKPAISKHLGNIFKEGELQKASVHSVSEYTVVNGRLL